MSTATATKERPILFSPQMVRAILARGKTQTRRVVKPQPPSIAAVRAMAGDGYGWMPPEGRFDYWRVVGPVWAVRECWKRPNGYPPNVNGCVSLRCPYGQVGGRLWVRESFITGWPLTEGGYLDQYDDDGNELPKKVWYRADLEELQWQSEDGYTMTEPPWKPSIHMPRWACRILLEVTEVRIEPLQAITEEDAIKEGFGPGFVPVPHSQFSDLQTTRNIGHRPLFIRLWDEINGASYPWASNPYVWALTFKQVPLSESAFFCPHCSFKGSRMKPLTFALLLFGLTTPAAAQITIVDNPYAPWSGQSGTKLTFSEPVTVSAGADCFVLDLSSLGNGTWAGFNLYLGTTPLVQATGIIPTVGTKIDSSVYYLYNPPTGALTLSGTLGSATAGFVNYYTLGNVDTTKAVVASSGTAGTNLTASLTLATSAGSFAAIDQAAHLGPSTNSFGATSGSPNPLTGGGVQTLFAADGYVQGLAGPSDTLTATINGSSPANHVMSAAVFTSLPVTGPPTWIASSGSWSAGGNWNTGIVPNAAGATAVFSQTASLTETITLDDSPTIGSLTLGNSGLATTSYVLTAGALTLNNSGSGAILTVSGSQEIDSQIAGSEALHLQGSGQLILSNSADSYSGGTFVDSGTLIVTSAGALPDGSSLTVGAGGTLIFDPSASAGGSPLGGNAEPAGHVAGVPEPGTIGLLAAFVACLILRRSSNMKRFLWFALFILISMPAFAGEGGTGLMGAEPGTLTLGMTGAAIGGILWIRHLRRRFKKIDQQDAEVADGDDA